MQMCQKVTMVRGNKVSPFFCPVIFKAAILRVHAICSKCDCLPFISVLPWLTNILLSALNRAAQHRSINWSLRTLSQSTTEQT